MEPLAQGRERPGVHIALRAGGVRMHKRPKSFMWGGKAPEQQIQEAESAGPAFRWLCKPDFMETHVCEVWQQLTVLGGGWALSRAWLMPPVPQNFLISIRNVFY